MSTTTPTPEVCGAAGCRATSDIQRVETERYGIRSLCASCRSDMA